MRRQSIEIVDKVVAGLGNRTRKVALRSLRRALQQHRRETTQRARLQAVLDRLVTLLSNTKMRVIRWPLEGDGFPIIAEGLERIFRRGRTAMAEAQEEESPRIITTGENA
jgi:hypothetical protein